VNRRTRRSLAVAALASLFAPVCLVALAPPAVSAGKGHDAASVDDARKKMEKGQSLFAQRQFAEAAAEFEAAHRAQPYSAFLYNAALAYDKAGDGEKAIARYRDFLTSEPGAPDVAEIRATIKRLEAQAAAASDGGAPAPALDEKAQAGQMRSLVLIESEPPGAPVSIWAAAPGAGHFKESDPKWTRIATNIKTPHDLSLAIGRYHVVIDAFKDYRRSETDINLAPGHVYSFKANLSQGQFLAFLKVSSKVEGAKIYLDDPPPHKKAPWGRTPFGALVPSGEHQVWIAAPGREPFTKKVTIEHGQTAEVDAVLPRVPYGYLRVDGNAENIEIAIDGVKHGSFSSGGPPVRVKLPAGKHKLELDASGRKTYEGEITIPEGQELPAHGTLIESYGRGKAIAAAAFSVGLAVGGGVMFKLAGDTQDQKKKDIFSGVSTGCFIGAGVAGAASIFLFIYDPNPDSLVKLDRPREFEEGETKSARLPFPLRHVTPAVSHEGGGMWVSGAF
jgi:tetratricopeptide (TPR) repeat protein